MTTVTVTPSAADLCAYAHCWHREGTRVLVRQDGSAELELVDRCCRQGCSATRVSARAGRP